MLGRMYIDPTSAAGSDSKVVAFYKILYGFLDMNFFNLEPLSFCLWRNATTPDMFAVKYGTILYTLLLIIVVIWAIDKCGGRCLRKCNCCRITTVRKSVVHGISTFLVICYSQCIRVSLGLLNPLHLSASRDSHLKPKLRVWLNGEIEYFSKEHYPYAIPAILSLVTIGFIPPALLMIFPLVNKLISALGCEDSSTLNKVFQMLSINSLKPFLDSFQGCFKDNCRFFAGLFFMHLSLGDRAHLHWHN